MPSTNEVSHTENWTADGDGHAADIVVEIKGVPVKIVGSKVAAAREGRLQPWSGISTSPAASRSLGGIIASFAGAEIEQKLEDEFKVLKSIA